MFTVARVDAREVNTEFVGEELPGEFVNAGLLYVDAKPLPVAQYGAGGKFRAAATGAAGGHQAVAHCGEALKARGRLNDGRPGNLAQPAFGLAAGGDAEGKRCGEISRAGGRGEGLELGLAHLGGVGPAGLRRKRPEVPWLRRHPLCTRGPALIGKTPRKLYVALPLRLN